MLQATLATIMKAVRLRYAIPFVLLLVGIYFLGLRPWMAHWGSTPTERQMALPGDHLIPDGAGRSTPAITINAPSDVVWQWLVQVGQARAGFDTYTWLENLFGADITIRTRFAPSGSIWLLAMAIDWCRRNTCGA